MIWLIARREVDERVRTRAYLITLVLLALGALALVMINAYAGRDDSKRTVAIGTVGDATALQPVLELVGRQSSTTFELHRFESVDALEASITEDAIDAGIDGNTIIWHREVGSVDGPAIAAAMQSAAVSRRAIELGVDESRVDEIFVAAAIRDRVLEPRSRDHNVRVATAGVSVVILFIALQLTASQLMTGLVVEKSTRVVEVLLNHVRARQLLAGKIIGIGIAGTAQMAATALVVLGALLYTRDVDVPGVPPDAVVWFVVWFVLGFGVHATLFAVAASLISRQEDAGAVTFPAMAPLLASYFLSFQVLRDPDSGLAQILSLVPLSAPLVMPVRIAAGNPHPLITVLSIALALATIVAFTSIAGRVYSATLLRTGARVSWKEAARAARRRPAAASADR